MSTSKPRVRRLRLGPRDAGLPLTDAEFARGVYKEPWRYELIDGRLLVLSPNGERHDDRTEFWRDHLVAYKLAHRDLVQKVISEAWVKVRKGQNRMGDLGVYLIGERSSKRRPARAPEWMLEVISKGKTARHRDLVEKRAEYYLIGVLEYVIVDPKRRRVHILTHQPAGYEERVLTEADTYVSPLLPGLEVPLAEAF